MNGIFARVVCVSFYRKLRIQFKPFLTQICLNNILYRIAVIGSSPMLYKQAFSCSIAIQIVAEIVKRIAFNSYYVFYKVSAIVAYICCRVGKFNVKFYVFNFPERIEQMYNIYVIFRVIIRITPSNILYIVNVVIVISTIV